MKLRIDTSRSYALALEGGGAKGAYQIGAWKALREAGVKIDAVAGTSVGALNGSLIVMGDLEKAENIWENIRYSQVMDVDDETMSRLLKGDVKLDELDSVAQQMFEVIKNRGFDVTPLRKWISQVVDEKTVRESPVELFIDTFSLSDGKLLELRAKDLPEGTLCDMLLASAYLPVFRSEKLGGKRYADGGLRDVLPLHVLIEHGYKDILALRLFGIGVERSVKIPEDTRVYTVEPTADLGSTLEFEPAQSRENLRAGYYDMQRFLYGLRGTKYYVDCDWDETKALSLLSDAASAGDAVRSKDFLRVSPILDYIRDHLSEPLTLDLIAGQFYISKYYMMRLFKQETGYTLGQYISQKRLLLAKELLSTGAPGTQVCYDCGFKDYSTFSRAYKQLFGVTPSGRTCP